MTSRASLFKDVTTETMFAVMETETMTRLTTAYWGHGIEGTLTHSFKRLSPNEEWFIYFWGDTYIATLHRGYQIDRICTFTADQWAEALASVNPPMSRTEELEIENAALKRQLETLKQVNAELGAHNTAILGTQALPSAQTRMIHPQVQKAADAVMNDFNLRHHQLVNHLLNELRCANLIDRTGDAS